MSATVDVLPPHALTYYAMRKQRPAAMDKAIVECTAQERDECYDFALRVATCGLSYSQRVSLIQGKR